MDKKLLLSSNLATIMELAVPAIDHVVDISCQKSVQFKSDGSPVTTLDNDLSDLLLGHLKKYYSDSIMYSEEEYSDWGFPLMAIDPIDGTKEYIQNIPEWVVSIGHIKENAFKGEGWIYNPSTKRVFFNPAPTNFQTKKRYDGEVSRTEWESGLFSNLKHEHFGFRPMGSIAYKLARLSAGESDFVVSLKPKNIWDIAAGTLLCKRAGMKFWSKGIEVKEVKKIYQPPLIWCHEELFSELSSLFLH